MDKELKCDGCDCIIPEGEELNLGGKVFCEDCYDNYTTCRDCDNIVHIEDTRDYHEQLLCEDCYDEHFAYCECCGESYDYDYDTGRGRAWGNMCQACSDEHFVCDSCGETLSNDDYGEDGYCRDCCRRNDEGIKEYHAGSNVGTVYHPNEEESLYFGVELETDDYQDRWQAAEELNLISNEENLFWLEQDSSLDNGIEIISQPCSLDYHREQFPWKKISETVHSHGGKSHNTNTCGLHIHFSYSFLNGKHAELYQLRLIYLFERFWDELVQFSRRGQEAVECSANKYGRELFDCSSQSKISELRNAFHRYQAVNITNARRGGTIEIRLFRGTLKVETILASIELVDFLVRLAKRTSNKQLQCMSWTRLLVLIDRKKYHYLLQALAQRGLYDTQLPLDYKEEE